MASLSSSPIFIVGTPRSGTTLTARILGRHSSLFMPGETHFFDDVYARRGKLGDPGTDVAARRRIAHRLTDLYARFNVKELNDQQRVSELFASQGLHDRLLQATSYRDAFAIFMDAQREAAGKRRWGNNVPRDLYHLETIFEFFPDAKVIVCTRHILDFMISYRDKWTQAERRSTPENARRLRHLYHPVTTALMWKSGMRTVIGALDRWQGRIMLNRYEDLVANPTEHLSRLCAFLGEEYEPGIANVDTNNSSLDIRMSGIFQNSVGRWRSMLPAGDAFIAQRLCRAELERLGYAVEPVPSPSPFQLSATALSAPAHLLRAMIANRGRYGPVIPFIMKRLRVLLREKRAT